MIKQNLTTLLVGVLAVILGIELITQVQKYAEDPLSIHTIDGNNEVSLSPGESFSFWRQVCVDKDIIVNVHREYHSLENDKKYMQPAISYVGNADDGCYDVEFSQIVPNLPFGLYEYRPVLIYTVNDSLTISKPAPSVLVEVIDENSSL